MILARLFARTRSFNLSAGMLVVLLQRTPVLRALITAESQLAPPAGSLLKALIAPIAALGAVHTLAGATTQLVASTTLPAKATAGTPFTMQLTITGTGVSFAQSWTVTNTLPPGVTPVGGVLTSGRYVINPSSGILTLSGTPTAAGTFSFTATGYQYANLTGPGTPGSTSIVVASAPNSAPAITRQPSDQTVSAGGTITLAVIYTGTPAPTFQWYNNGTAVAGGTGPTLTIANATAANAGSYTVKITNSLGTVTSSAVTVTVNAAPAAPTFAAVPLPQTATVGGAVIFSVDVTGVPAPTLQWLKDGIGLDGQTSATLILNNVQMDQAGLYAVTAANASGAVTSSAASLTVAPVAAPPVFSAQPAPLTGALGSTVVFSAAAAGVPAPTYQWQHNGTNIPGANSALLVLSPTVATDAGDYDVVATNSSGVVSSATASLALSPSPNPGRLINLSILTALAPGETMAMGTVLGGAGTSGTKALVARAAGPSLVPFGVTSVVPNPTMTLVGGPGVGTVASNSGWAGSTTLASTFSQVGAFPYIASTSKDSAIYQPSLAPGSYTVQVSDANGVGGSVLAELYDATPGSAVTAATPRLVNVSVLKNITTGGMLTAGFVVSGATAKTVLIRAIGPGLTAFGVTGFMADPRLAVVSSGTTIALNEDWGGALELTTASKAVGAFGITSTDSRDAMLLITLPPGSYSAQVSPSTNAGLTTGGTALVEVYEVP